MQKYNHLHISKIKSWDVRFPTSEQGHGSDAVHGMVDYSCVYVQIFVTGGDGEDVTGCGLTFTLGRGNEVVMTCVESLKGALIGSNLASIFDNFGDFALTLCNDNQMRWLGPDCGVINLASCAILNALWDLWAKLEQKPLWILLCELPAQILYKCGIWKYLSDEINRDEAMEVLEVDNLVSERLGHVTDQGLKAYTTTCGWLGYTDEQVKNKIQTFMDDGWDAFKLKVGVNLYDDIRRCQLVRDLIGPQGKLMIDCNQKWEVTEAVNWVENLTPFNIYWIEEPTAPDDVIGHKKVKDRLGKHGVRIATGEVCRNRVMFKQFCSQKAFDICQIDCARVASINELIPILVLCKKFSVPVCPHGGGVGLCEMIQHVSAFNYVRVAKSQKDCLVEHADHLSQYFQTPIKCTRGKYILPEEKESLCGYSTTLTSEALAKYAVSMSE